MSKRSDSYPFKVWALAMLLGSLIFTLSFFIMPMSTQPYTRKWMLLMPFLFLMLGSAISLLTFLFFLLAYYQLNRIHLSIIAVKVVLLLIALLGMALTFHYLSINPKNVNLDRPIVVSYVLGVVMAVFWNKVKEQEQYIVDVETNRKASYSVFFTLQVHDFLKQLILV